MSSEMNVNEVGSSLLETIRDADNLKDVLDQLGEVALDELLDEGLLKDLPVVGLIRKLCKATGSISDYLLAKKILLFLAGLDKVSPDQKRQAIAKIAVDLEHRRQVGENLMLLLDKLDDMQKPVMLARAWRAFLEGRIDRLTLFRLHRAIDQIDVADIPVLRDLYREQTSSDGLRTYPVMRPGRDVIEEPDPKRPEDSLVNQSTWDQLVRLATCGLLSMVLGRAGGFSPVVGGLRFNDLGRVFVQTIVE